MGKTFLDLLSLFDLGTGSVTMWDIRSFHFKFCKQYQRYHKGERERLLRSAVNYGLLLHSDVI